MSQNVMTILNFCDTASLIQTLVDESKEQLSYFFDSLDSKTIQALFDHLKGLEGTLFVSGVGKSSIVAKKIVATMNATGTKALYLSPLNALHGDIGIVGKNDTVLLLSKSGESDEILNLCPALRNKGAYLVAVVSSQHSRLAKACDMTVMLPIQRELCPFDMAPTVSTQAQQIFGDILSIALMRHKGFTVEEFRGNHPAGRLGKRLMLTVKDLMLSGDAVPLANPDEVLINALTEFSSKKCGTLIIVNESKQMLGIFTDGDLRRSLQKHGAMVLHKTMQELMTPSARSTSSHVLAYDAMKSMESDQKRPITVLPVIDEGRVVGILRMHDIVQSGIS